MEMEAYPKYDDKNIPMKLTHLKNGSQILVVAHFVLSFSELILNLNPPNKFYRQKWKKFSRSAFYCVKNYAHLLVVDVDPNKASVDRSTWCSWTKSYNYSNLAEVLLVL